MTLYSKRLFIKAYTEMYGVSEADARRVWKNEKDNPSYVNQIIKSFETTAKKAFYCD